MKTVRFAKVVEAAGRPETYLPLMDPKKDPSFQKALKAHRVMTVFQNSVGTATDHGEIGFEAGIGRQFLIFPKSLAPYAGGRVVGVKYDLLDEGDVSPKPKAEPPKAKPKVSPKPKLPKERPSDKVVPFPREHAKEKQEEPEDELAPFKAQVRRAMKELEAGRQMPAFRILEKLVED